VKVEQFKNWKNMKIKTAIAFALSSATTLFCLTAGDQFPAPPKASAELEKMKSLVGSWQGKADVGQGPIDMTVKYRLLAGGTVLEERCFPDTPMEMVTMFYDKAGKLAMTHYCVLGNRPAMTLKSSDDKSLTFDFDPSCGINTKTEMHMHAMSLSFDNPDTITTTCKSLANGQEQESHACTLKRVKS
jgi:hypothetical protein